MSSGGSKPANPNGALMRTWSEFKKSEVYDRSARWAEVCRITVGRSDTFSVEHPHAEGTHWSMFMHGFLAAQEAAKEIALSEAQSVDEGEIYIARKIADAIATMNDPKDCPDKKTAE